MIDTPVISLPDKVLALPVDDLELSVRTSNCLRAAGFTTVSDLVDVFNRGDRGRSLLEIKNLGRKSYNELRAVLGYLSKSSSREKEVLAWVADHGAEVEAIIRGHAVIVPTYKGYDRW